MASLDTSGHALAPAGRSPCTDPTETGPTHRELARRHRALSSGRRSRGGREEPDWSPGRARSLPAVSSCGLSPQQSPTTRGDGHLPGTPTSTSVPVAHDDTRTSAWWPSRAQDTPLKGRFFFFFIQNQQKQHLVVHCTGVGSLSSPGSDQRPSGGKTPLFFLQTGSRRTPEGGHSGWRAHPVGGGCLRSREVHRVCRPPGTAQRPHSPLRAATASSDSRTARSFLQSSVHEDTDERTHTAFSCGEGLQRHGGRQVCPPGASLQTDEEPRQDQGRGSTARASR